MMIAMIFFYATVSLLAVGMILWIRTPKGKKWLHGE